MTYLRLLLCIALVCLVGAVPAVAIQSPSAIPSCPTNQSQAGCNTPEPPIQPHFAPAAAPSGPLLPDVSVFQGVVGWGSVAAWQRAHGWHPGAIFKMGEFTLDRQAVRNANETARLGFWRAGYWFIRNTGCAHESALIIWAAKFLRVNAVVLDAEVPEAAGYSRCLAPAVRQAGYSVVEYTSPGSNPDSSNPGLNMWTAAYGPAHTPCVWTCNVGVTGLQSILAWQFTDGRFGSVVNIPGIGTDDVSVDYGISKLGVARPKPVVRYSSAEVQLPNSLNGTATVKVSHGHWTVSTKGWRIGSMPLNAPPLGG